MKVCRDKPRSPCHFVRLLLQTNKIDVCLHLFDILLSALGVMWCWGIIGWFWVLSSYNSRLRWMWLGLTLSTYYYHYHHHHNSPPPLFTLGSLQCCVNENASRTLAQEKRIICHKGIIPVSKWSFECGVECLPDIWQETFVQEVAPVCLHWSGKGQGTI
jgi:hypothetical protein